ncbi:MAG TPA: OmpA family protein [Gemmatimonadaceae bacterium]
MILHPPPSPSALKPMSIHRFLPVAAALLCVAASAGAAHAQRAPSGLIVGSSALLPSQRFTVDALTGANASLSLGVSSRVSLLAGASYYRSAETSSGRSLDLLAPSVLLRATVAGDRNDLALIGGAGLLRFDLGAEASGVPGAEVKNVPSLAAGASVRLHLAGPFGVEIGAVDWMSMTRAGELDTPSGSRALSHNPEIRISLTALFRKSEPTTASFADLPVSYSSDFRPVDAATLTRSPTREASGRDHLHVDQGTAVDLRVVDTAQLNGKAAPGSLSLVAPAEPSDRWVEQKLGAIYFESGSSVVATSYRTLLGDVAKYLAQNAEARLELHGYTDPHGSAQMNLSLAERRGTTVEELLVRLFGVAPDRVRVTSYGIDYRAKSDAIARRVDIAARLPVKP